MVVVCCVVLFDSDLETAGENRAAWRSGITYRCNIIINDAYYYASLILTALGIQHGPVRNTVLETRMRKSASFFILGTFGARCVCLRGRVCVGGWVGGLDFDWL